MTMTCMGEHKVETQEAIEVVNLPEAGTLLQEMIWMIPVLLPIVMVLMSYSPI